MGLVFGVLTEYPGKNRATLKLFCPLRRSTNSLISILILSTTLGSFSNLLAQENTLFAETYKRSEITSLFEKGDRFFELLNSQGNSTGKKELKAGPYDPGEYRQKHCHCH